MWNVEDGWLGSWPLQRVHFPGDKTPNEWLLVKTLHPSYLGFVEDGLTSIAGQATFMKKSTTLYSLLKRRLQREGKKDKRQPLGTSESEQGMGKNDQGR